MIKKYPLFARCTVALAAASLVCFAAAAQAQEESSNAEQTVGTKHESTSKTGSGETKKETTGTGDKLVGKPGSVSAKDANFVKMAAMGGIKEVELGKVAAKQAKSPEVKQFGERMVTDHSKANKELMAIAKKKGIKLEKEPLDSSKLNGPDFDSVYTTDMVKDHEKDVAEFQTEAKKGEDPEIKAFAEKTLPTLKEHLQMIKQIKAKGAQKRS